MRPEVVVLPLGSTEPHGGSMPYGTDTDKNGDAASF